MCRPNNAIDGALAGMAGCSVRFCVMQHHHRRGWRTDRKGPKSVEEVDEEEEAAEDVTIKLYWTCGGEQS